jgi:hypothetical protein
MAADTSVVKPVEAPALTPLKLKSRLAPTPTQAPRYAVSVVNGAGKPVSLGDPRATRALVALMNVHAVNGGAACHWGGPAAFAEINSAIHGLPLRASTGRPWHEAYNFVNDAGHTENGLYALRANYGFDGLTFESLKGFRGIHSKLTGHGEGAPESRRRPAQQRPRSAPPCPRPRASRVADKVSRQRPPHAGHRHVRWRLDGR